MHGWLFLSYFFGGAFLANALPHLINGISGSAYQTPFAKPLGRGLSSSTVNILWGYFNLAAAYLLIVRVGRFDLDHTSHVFAVGAGMLLISLLLARTFGRLHGGQI
jgi:hypothetical protein